MGKNYGIIRNSYLIKTVFFGFGQKIIVNSADWRERGRGGGVITRLQFFRAAREAAWSSSLCARGGGQLQVVGLRLEKVQLQCLPALQTALGNWTRDAHSKHKISNKDKIPYD